MLSFLYPGLVVEEEVVLVLDYFYQVLLEAELVVQDLTCLELMRKKC